MGRRENLLEQQVTMSDIKLFYYGLHTESRRKSKNQRTKPKPVLRAELLPTMLL